MRLKELLSGIYDGRLDDPFADYEISSLSCDSRTAEAQSLFVALSGMRFDGNNYIRDAVARGATVVVRSVDQTAEIGRAQV